MVKCILITEDNIARLNSEFHFSTHLSDTKPLGGWLVTPFGPPIGIESGPDKQPSFAILGRGYFYIHYKNLSIRDDGWFEAEETGAPHA